VKLERRRLRQLEEQRMNERVEKRRAELENLTDSFERMLGDHGIKIPSGSKLEQALLLPRHIKYIREEDAPLPKLSPEDEDDMFRRVTWLWGAIPRLLEASAHPDFRELVPHLKLVVDGEFAQNVPGERDQESDKLFELAVALALLPVSKNMKVDTGDSSSKNPDLLFDFQGTRWGIACKALYTSKPERYRDSVIKGASQIEKSEAQRGVVCVSLRNLLNHSLFLPRRGEFLVGMPKDAARSLLGDEESRIQQEIIEPVTADIGEDFKTRSKVETGVVHVSTVCARTGSPDDIRMTYLAHIMTVGRVYDPLVDALNAGLQAIQPPLL
jgi:hypothetical protein